MNSPPSTTDFADEGLVRFESQQIDPVAADSSDDEEHAELEVEDHLEYRVNRMLGGKADTVREQLDTQNKEADCYYSTWFW